MMNPNVFLSEQTKLVVGFAPAVPSSSVGTWVNMKNYPVLTIIIMQANGIGPTGSAITLKQALDVSGGSSKALSFTQAKSNTDISVNDTLTNFAVVSNTFTTDTTASKNAYYEIEVHDQDLDQPNKFIAVAALLATATNSTIAVLYVLWPAKYGKGTPPSAVIN